MSTRNGSHYENHQRAAELHEGAAHAHLAAAEHAGKQDHQTGHEQSRQALEHSRQAYMRSQEAHQQTTKQHGVAAAAQEDIAALAHRLWQARGCPEGSAEQDWLEAVEQLSSHK